MAWLRAPEAVTKIYSTFFRGIYSYTFDGIPLFAERLSYPQKMNLLLAGMDMVLGRTRMLSLPPVIHIEPTNTCNLKCPLCPTGTTLLTRPKGFMAPETFQGVLEELGDVLVAVYLFCFGEPFLHKDMPRMIEALTRKKILTLISTNGHFLQTFDEAMAVVKAGLKTLIIALDGSNQQIYEKYRVNGNFEKVKQCAAMVEAAKIAAGSAYPYTVIRTVATKDNESDLPNIEQLAKNLGVNMFSYKSLGCMVNGDNYEVFSPRKRSLRRFGGSEEANARSKHVKCPFPFRQPIVFWDGTVSGCEYDHALKASYGKIGKTSFKTLWNSEKALQLRTQVLNGFDLPEFCLHRCPYRSRDRKTSELYCKEFRRGGIRNQKGMRRFSAEREARER